MKVVELTESTHSTQNLQLANNFAHLKTPENIFFKKKLLTKHSSTLGISKRRFQMSSLKDLHFLSDVCDGAWFSFLHIKEDEDKEKGINFFF